MAIATDEAGLTLEFLDHVFGSKLPANVGFRLWDGTRWPETMPRAASIVLNHSGALQAMLHTGTEAGLAEAYLSNDFDVEGDMQAVFSCAEAVQQLVTGTIAGLDLARMLRRLPASRPTGPQQHPGAARLKGQRHSVKRDGQAVRYHYDVPGDFYRLWLDRRMVYSCGYFRTGSEPLDIAQEDKLEYICRKLRLKPGQRLLDIGCGWGGLLMHAAGTRGVDATGITLSQPQADLAAKRISEAGLANRARVAVSDYRDLDGEAAYDAIVSVGMFEHVGASMLPEYFARAYRLLKPSGVFLNHGIATGNRRITWLRPRGSSFVHLYVFPDGELVPIAETLRAAEGTGFEVRDVESLREHYHMTLRHWVSRLEGAHQAALRSVDERTYRVWRLFMSGSAYGFAAGLLNVYQTLLAKPDATGPAHLPLTREDWYCRRA